MQRSKVIETQHWMSEMKNDIRGDADQNKMRKNRKFKTIENYKCEDYLRQVTNTRHRVTNKIAIKKSQTRHRNGPILKTLERICPICKLEMDRRTNITF